jgi:hypothetical protein
MVLILGKVHDNHETQCTHIPKLISEFRPNDNTRIQPK